MSTAAILLAFRHVVTDVGRNRMVICRVVREGRVVVHGTMLNNSVSSNGVAAVFKNSGVCDVAMGVEDPCAGVRRALKDSWVFGIWASCELSLGAGG